MREKGRGGMKREPGNQEAKKVQVFQSGEVKSPIRRTKAENWVIAYSLLRNEVGKKKGCRGGSEVD